MSIKSEVIAISKDAHDALIEKGFNFETGRFPEADPHGYKGSRDKAYDKLKKLFGNNYGHILIIGYDPENFMLDIISQRKNYRGYTPEELKESYLKKPYQRLLGLCDCGSLTYVNLQTLREGKLTSCGCKQSEVVANSNQNRTKSGMGDTRIWKIYDGMIYRCYNPNSNRYYLYGGRGIGICKEWYCPKDNPKYGEKYLKGFMAFARWAYSHGFYEQDKKTTKNGDLLTIERKDIDKGYSPDNCIFITKSQQALNRSTTKYLELDTDDEDQRITVYQLIEKYRPQMIRTARATNTPLSQIANVVYSRLHDGWKPYDAVTTPSRATRASLSCSPIPRDIDPRYISEYYDGPRYAEGGELRDKDGFLVLDMSVKFAKLMKEKEAARKNK